MVSFFYYIMAFLLSSLYFSLSQESYFGTVENIEHTKEFYLFIKDMNDYCFERLNKMSLLILHLINCYTIYSINHVSE